jgi:glyoxylase-like metal-dependent hydrolase (beta-lactamase superfamily II)
MEGKMTEFIIVVLFAAGFGVLALKARKLCAAMLLISASILSAQNSDKGAEIFTFKIGDAEFISFVTSRRDISDDTFTTPDLLKVYKNTPNYADSAINYFLLKDKGEYALFDAGLPKSANNDMVLNLAKVGVKPSQIKTIYLTHMHGDHIGGLVENGAAVFPNAKLYIPKDEFEYWKERNEQAKSVFALYGKKLEIFSKDAKITPLITAIQAYGHTPGYTAYKVGNGDEAILVWGDIIHANVQFAEPKITLRYDVDPTLAYDSRLEMLKLAVTTKLRVAGMHLSASGVGKVEQLDDNSFRFIPLNAN